MTPINCRGCGKEQYKYDENAHRLFLGSTICTCGTFNDINMWINDGVRSYEIDCPQCYMPNHSFDSEYNCNHCGKVYYAVKGMYKNECVFCGKESSLNICHKCMNDVDCCQGERDEL